jgi:hypothetical protein
MDWKVYSGIGFGFFISLMLGFFIIPIDMTIERAVLVEATPEEIYPHIVDLQRWDAWNPWDVAVLGEPTRGEGARLEWPRGGMLRIEDVEQDIRMHYIIDAVDLPTSGSLELLNDAKGTVIVWTHYTQTGYLPSARLAAWVARAELALEMDEGLNMLKSSVETL